MLITISGPSGSGKSSAAAGLAKKLGIRTVDAGAVFRKMAKEHGMSVGDFGLYAEKHPEIDRQFDKRLLALGSRGRSIILQGRLTGLLSHREGMPAIRIWITASARTRAKRIAQRENKPFARVYRETQARDADNVARYKKTYGLDITDTSVYDFVVKTDRLTLDEVVGTLYKYVKPLWPRKRSSRRSPRK